MIKLESAIETEFKSYVNTFGCFYLKLSILGFAGFPDRLILGKNRLMFFIEWKRPGELNKKRRGERLQRYRHDTLRKYGFGVYVLDDLAKAKEVFNAELNRV